MNTETTQDEAVAAAKRASDEYALPQTVFKNEDTCGWWHTNPLSTALKGAQVVMTVLPSRYFS